MRLIKHAALFSFFCWPMGIYALEDAHSPGAEHAETPHHANEIAVFVGLTHENREEGPALGLEYERRLTSSLGVGVLAEQTWGDLDFWVYAVPITFHSNRWKFIAAPGVEQSHGQTEKLARLAIGYEFETMETKFSPSLSIDFVGGDVVTVLGVSIGIGF